MIANDLSRPVKKFINKVHTILYQEQTIDEALATVRQRKIKEKIIYFYVVDQEERLQGIISTRQLLLAEPQLTLKEIMAHAVITLRENQTLQEAMELLAKHRLLALPVVDKDHKLLGIIDVDVYLEESVEVINTRHAIDAFQMLGLTLEMGKHKTPWKNYQIRMPWILCNMVGGIACAGISLFFELVLSKVILLAMFIPLILTLSESISMQSMTQSLHFLRQARVSTRRIFKRVLTEAKMVILLALTCGLLVGCISLLWGGGIASAITIALAIFISISVSASTGASIPLILHARSLDPKVASGPVVLMLADVITTTVYLSLATWILL